MSGSDEEPARSVQAIDAEIAKLLELRGRLLGPVSPELDAYRRGAADGWERRLAEAIETGTDADACRVLDEARAAYSAAERRYLDGAPGNAPELIRLAVADGQGTVYRDVPRQWLDDPTLMVPPAAYTLGLAVLELLGDLDRINTERAAERDGD